MNITVELNGVLRRLAGAERMTLTLPDGATLDSALAQVEAQVPEAADVLAASACAMGAALVPRSSVLNDGDAVVLLPPISGG